MSLTEEEYRALTSRKQVPAKTVAKYRNQKVVVNGKRFDSKREGAVYAELLLREKALEIQDVRCQVPFALCAAVTDRDLGVPLPVVLLPVAQYIADFTWHEGFEFVVADVKGFRTKEYQLKKRWMKAQYGIDVREIR